MTDYEYKVIRIPLWTPAMRARALNKWGRRGWQVVATKNGGLLSSKDEVTLCRPRPDRTAKIEVTVPAEPSPDEIVHRCNYTNRGGLWICTECGRVR